MKSHDGELAVGSPVWGTVSVADAVGAVSVEAGEDQADELGSVNSASRAGIISLGGDQLVREVPYKMVEVSLIVAQKASD